MLPPVFSLLSNDAAVGALLGAGNACRVYPWGSAADNVAKPYVTWYVVTGIAENTQSDPPPMDSFTTQIDVWGDDTGSTVAAAQAVRNAIETIAYVTGYNPSDRDPDTGRFRYSFDAEFVVKRS